MLEKVKFNILREIFYKKETTFSASIVQDVTLSTPFLNGNLFFFVFFSERWLFSLTFYFRLIS